MKQATHESQFIVQDDIFRGVNLGFDFTAEHEWGVKGIREAFGVGKINKPGIASRTITKLPDTEHFNLTNKNYLVFNPYSNIEQTMQNYKHILGVNKIYPGDNYKPSAKNEIYYKCAFAWDEKSFAIAPHDKETAGYVKELWKAFQIKDIVLNYNMGNPFGVGSSGLGFWIKSRLPQSVLDRCLEFDLEHIQLTKEANATGIEKYLKEHNKGWYSLTPKYLEKNGKKVLHFWLNPYEQSRYESGYFTVEDLKLWAIDQGPVMKTAVRGLEK